MDKNYVITSNGGFISEDELAHWGIKGMRWGRRNYQNEDGSLTAAGRERYGVGEGRNSRGGDRSTSSETNPRKSRGTGTDSSGRSERVNKKEATKAKKLAETKKQEEAKKSEETKKQEEAKKAEETKKQEEAKKSEAKVEEKKSNDDSDGNKTKLDGKPLDEISDRNLKARLERMRNEDAYDKMMVERGYVQVEKYSDMDRKISELKKQKEYSDLLVGLNTQSQISELSRQKELKQLQRDIKNLDKELNAKEKSAMQKVGERMLNEVVVDSAVAAGKHVLTEWLKKKGMGLITKNLGDGADDAANAVLDKAGSKLKDKTDKVVDLTKQEMAKQAAKEAAKEAKADAKAAKKAAKQAVKEAAKQAKDDEKVYEGEVIDTFKKSGSDYLNSGKSTRSNVIDLEYDVVSDNYGSSSTKSTAALGQKSISGYLTSPSSSSTISLGQRSVSGYLSAPASSNSSTPALGERKVAGLLNAPASSSSSKKFSTSITKNATGTTARIKSMKATGNYTNAEIADKLGISVSTLNNYLYGGDN